MRVVLLTAHWPPRLSGCGDYAWHLAEALSNRPVDVTVVVPGQGDHRQHPEFAVQRAPFPRRPRDVRTIVKQVRALDPDIVCLQFEAHAFELRAVPHLLPLALRAAGLRVMVFLHELWPPRHWSNAAKLVLLNAPHAIGVATDWHAAGVQRFRKIGDAPVVIPIASNIVAPSGTTLDRARFGITEDEKILTFFGFVGPQHCIAELIEAFAEVRDQYPEARLSMIGAVDFEKNGYHQGLRRRLEELALTDSVVWHGRVEDGDAVARLINVSDLGVIPYEEGVGENNTAFAAFAHLGVPTVTTRGPRSARLEERGAAGFAQPTGAGLRAAILGLLGDAALRDEVRAAALRWAAEHSWETTAERYSREFERIKR